MKRRHWLLLILIVFEVLAGYVVLSQRRSPQTPPAADLTLIDPLTADHLRALRDGCRSIDDWAKLGKAYQAFGYFAESEACFRYVSAREPARADLAFEWAFALERLGRIEDANAQYHRAIKLGYDEPLACWYFIGRNHLRLEDAKSADEAFRKAGEMPAARYERSRLRLRDGDRLAAETLLDRLLMENPEAIPLHQFRHRLAVLADGPDFARTADLAGRATRPLLSPFDAECARLEVVGAEYLGTTQVWQSCQGLMAAGEVVAVRERLEAALDRHWDAGMVDLLAEVELRGDRKDEAVRRLSEVVERAGPSVHTLTRLGAAYYRTGKPDLAAQVWTRAAQLGVGGKVKDLHHKLATYHEEKKDDKLARWHHAQAYHAKGHEAFWAGNLPVARVAMQQAVEYQPDQAASWCYLGDTQRLLGQPAEARLAYERCLKIDPDHGRALAGLALLGPGK